MFDPEEFLKRPPQEILDTLKALSLTRDELVVLARHLEIEPKTSSTEKGTYTENMSKRKKEHHKHLEENQRQHEEKHQKEEEERRKRAVAKPAKEKKESEDEDEEEVK